MIKDDRWLAMTSVDKYIFDFSILFLKLCVCACGIIGQ